MPKEFARNNQASIASFTAIFMLVMACSVGIALDVSRLNNTKTKAQDIADSVAVATLYALVDGDSEEDAEKIGRAFFEGNYAMTGDPNLVTLTIAVTNSAGGITVDTKLDGSMKTSFMNVIGIADMEFQVDATSATTFASNPIELVIAADISFSMGKDGKLASMKSALKELIDLIYPDELPNENIRTTILPYAESIHFGDAYESWLNAGELHEYIGCFSHESDGQVRSGSMYPISPGEYEAYTGGSNFCPEDLATSSFFEYDPAPLKEKIDDFAIKRGTSTDLATMWAYRALSPTWRGQFVSGSDSHLYPQDFGSDTTKHMIILTDGEAKRWTPRGAEIGDMLGDSEGRKIALDNFVEICKEMASEGNIHVSTVAFGFSPKDVAMHKHLKDCASGHGRYFKASTSNLDMVLRAIGSSINRLRLIN